MINSIPVRGMTLTQYLSQLESSCPDHHQHFAESSEPKGFELTGKPHEVELLMLRAIFHLGQKGWDVMLDDAREIRTDCIHLSVERQQLN